MAIAVALVGSDDYAFNVHVARLIVVALYPVTLWLAFLTLRRIFPDMPVAPVWGVAGMASVPIFTLVHSYYTNDAPAVAAGTLATYAIVRALQSRFAARDTALLGLSLGVVGLHKYTGFLVFPAAAIAVLWNGWRQPLRLIKTGAALLALATAVSSWWYIRNHVIYGDPIGVAVTQAAVDASGGAPIPPRTRGLTPGELVQETNWIGENFATFWAGYGRVKLKLLDAAYVALSVLSVAAVVGLAWRTLAPSVPRPGAASRPSCSSWRCCTSVCGRSVSGAVTPWTWRFPAAMSSQHSWPLRL